MKYIISLNHCAALFDVMKTSNHMKENRRKYKKFPKNVLVIARTD